MKLTLETNRLILRPFNIDDAQDMFDNWASDSDVTKYLTWNHHTDINQTKEILNIWIDQYQKPERINFAITLKETNELIGGIDVVGYLDGVPVIGYAISKKHWNKGFTTEVCKKLIEYLFSIGHKKIRIDAVVENIASNKVIKKCGGILFDTVEEFIKSKNETVKINCYYIEMSDFNDN